MTDPPERYKQLDDLTVEEHAARLRDPNAKFETDDYRRAKTAALQKAGLLDDDDQPPEDVGTWTTEQHFRNMTRGGHR
jgi:hypothetical protein